MHDRISSISNVHYSLSPITEGFLCILENSKSFNLSLTKQ